MPMLLLDLPDEVLERSLGALDASTLPNPYYSLILVCKRLFHIALPRLCEIITIRRRAQLEALVDKQTSGAWKLPISIRIRHFSLHVTSLDLFELFLCQEGRVSIHPTILKLVELVSTASTGCLDTFSVNIKFLNGILPVLDQGAGKEGSQEQNHNNRGDEAEVELQGQCKQAEADAYLYQYFSPSFLAIPARTIECAHADALLEDRMHGLTVELSCLAVRDLMSANVYVNHLRLPCLDLTSGAEKLVSDLKHAPTKITRLQLDWPRGLRISTLLSLLLELGDVMEEKGLIIAAPSTHLSTSHPPEHYLQHFYIQNPGLRSPRSMSILRDILAKKGAEAMMSKLDWRVESE